MIDRGHLVCLKCDVNCDLRKGLVVNSKIACVGVISQAQESQTQITQRSQLAEIQKSCARIRSQNLIVYYSLHFN